MKVTLRRLRPDWVARGLLIGTLGVVPAFHAAATPPDLGDGLAYVRVHTVPQDLPTASGASARGCVLDLRYAHGTADAGSVLGAWLKFHATTRTPIFVLENGATAPTLLAALAHRDATPGLLVIGPAAPSFSPDITVEESAAEERQAYDAMDKGTSVLALTTDNPDKQRNDEASLARERTPEAADDPADQEDSPSPPQKPQSPPLDAALQEAIHLYQGLRAMKVL